MDDRDLLVLLTLIATIWNLQVNYDIKHGGERREVILKNIEDKLNE